MQTKSLSKERRQHNEDLGWREINTAPKICEFRCLLTHGDSIVTGYWDGDKWINERSIHRGEYNPTHWMPLPYLPITE